ncbi:MAG: division/cell wall cluster transcriptional repressor MraZ [Flavobacteriaceae bacterium]|nr:division/cell wall cluster transcriptional repressor MraZ [Flavobacteriaceae bacterium]
MSHLIGTYHCKADPKGRVKIPRALTKQLAGARQETFVIKRAVFQPCLELYSLKEWNALMAKVNKLNRFNKKNNDFIRRFTAGVKVVELDATDRLLIPRDLAKFAEVDKAVVLSAAVNIIEIWDKDCYEKAIDEAAVDFAALAEEVMGDDQDNVS